MSIDEKRAQVGDVIQPGQPIPDNVTEVDDRVRDGWRQFGDGWRLVRYRGESCEDAGKGLHSDTLVKHWSPLTVTAVREPEPAVEPELVHYYVPEFSGPSGATLCGLGIEEDMSTTGEAGKATCAGCRAAADEDVPAAEPEQVDVLDLVRQFGAACATMPMFQHGGNARELFARIEAEVQRLKDAAEADATGDLAAQRDDAQRARDFLAEQVVRPARAALDAVGIGGGVKLVDRILTLANERDEARTKASHLAVELAATEQMLKVATATPAPDAPLVLSLPEVPRGTVALIGAMTKARYTPQGGRWWSPNNVGWTFSEMLGHEGSVTVEMAPPSEPRTWAAIPSDPGDVEAFKGASGTVYRFRHAYNGIRRYAAPGGGARPLERWQVLDGPLTEVFEDGAR